MKKIIIKIITYAVFILIIVLMKTKINNLNAALDISVNNEKAYAAENSELIKNNRVFKLSLEQIEYYNDSLILAMKNIAKENKIKERKIKSMQYLLEKYSKKDTIVLRDTIFKNPNFVLDTCLVNKWSKSCLHLKYPNLISLQNEYNNEKYIILHSHKEPVKPRKWFLPRWFTRKHTVVEVTVVDQNPYVQTKKQKFIEVIK